jgi:HEPN domain-containing protein
MRAIDQAQLLQRKAAQDLAVLRKLINDPTINTETLGFHAQQAAEKLIKALLALGGHDYPRTHDLGLLLDLLASVDVCIPRGAADRGEPDPLRDRVPLRRPPAVRQHRSAGVAANSLSVGAFRRRGHRGGVGSIESAMTLNEALIEEDAIGLFHKEGYAVLYSTLSRVRNLPARTGAERD